jgi:hypothetical protein
VLNNGPVLYKKTNKIALKLKVDHFKVSGGSLHMCNLRNDVQYKITSGEMFGVSQESVDHWSDHPLPVVMCGVK